MISERTDVFVWVLIAPVIANLILNAILIPKYGLIGAVIATCFAYALGLVLAIIIGRRYYPLPLPVKAFFQIGFACMVMAAIVYNLPMHDSWPDIIHLVLKGGVGIFVYIITSWFINSAGCRGYIKSYIATRRRNDEVYNS